MFRKVSHYLKIMARNYTVEKYLYKFEIVLPYFRYPANPLGTFRLISRLFFSPSGKIFPHPIQDFISI